MPYRNLIKILLAAFAGILNTLSFAPFNWWPLGLVSFAVLFGIWLVSGTRGAMWCGFTFGVAMFGVGASWVYISLHTYGGMPTIVAGLFVFAGICFISIFPMLCGWLQSLFSKWNAALRLSIIMPVSWILFEWLRGWIFTGFPWLSTGYAWLDTPLSNYAPIGGVYLVGLIVLLSAGLTASIIRRLSVSNGIAGLLLIAVWAGGWFLNQTAWTQAEGEPVSVAIIQNNVSIAEKWDRSQSSRIISEYLSKSRQHQDVDLIVWPEAAVPEYTSQLTDGFWSEVRAHPADFIFGVLYQDETDGQRNDYNSAVAVTDDQVMIYRKRHLVPFGEYLPLRDVLGGLVEMVSIPMSDFSAWEQPQSPLIAAGNQFAVTICFEDIFPNESKDQVAVAGALLNISEDIWFGDSLAPHQRLQMARFRSRESERPMIRSSNNGLSSLINWKGGIEDYAPQFVQQALKGSIQPRTGVTPYTVFGDKPVFALMALLLLGAFSARNVARKR